MTIIGKEVPTEKERNVVSYLKRRFEALEEQHSIPITYENNHGSMFSKRKLDATITMGVMFTFHIELKITKGKVTGKQRDVITQTNERHPGTPCCVAFGRPGCDKILDLSESFLRSITAGTPMRGWSTFCRTLRTTTDYR